MRSACVVPRSDFSPGSFARSNRCSPVRSFRYFQRSDARRVRRSDSPEQRAIVRRALTRTDWQQVLTVEVIRRICLGPGCREDGGRPVHRDCRLLGHSAGRYHSRPADDRRDSNSPLVQGHFPRREWPVEGVALPTVVAGEDDQRLALQFCSLERAQDPADPGVQAGHHLSEDLRVNRPPPSDRRRGLRAPSPDRQAPPMAHEGRCS